jgi:CheY-like chemotaxis protein
MCREFHQESKMPEVLPVRGRHDFAASEHNPARINAILIVEDEDDIRALAVEILQTHGHHVRCARTGLEAVEILRKKPADLDAVHRYRNACSGRRARLPPLPACCRTVSDTVRLMIISHITPEERLVSIVLTSNTAEILFTARYFARLFSTSAKSPGETIRESFRRRGYILLRDALDRAAVLDLRAAYLGKFPDSLFKTGTNRVDGRFSGYYPLDLPRHGTPGHPAHAFVRGDQFRSFVATERLQGLAEILLGGSAVRLRRTPLRHFLGGSKVASRAHIDYSYLDAGSSEIVTFWIPIGECPLVAGGVIYLENSTTLDFDAVRRGLPTDREHDARPLTHDLRELADRTGKRWLWTNFAAGDVVAHSPFMVHASVNAQSDRMRISIDVRFVRTGTAVDPRWTDDWSADDGY